MKAPNTPEMARQTALAELASLTSIEFGTLSEFHRGKPAADGNSAVRRGPYFKHQCWENGRNRSTYIPAEQIESLRQDLENGKRFNQITSELAAAAIQQSRAKRAAVSLALGTVEKKTSKPNASQKNTAKRNTSSPKRVKSSPARKKGKP
jgi:hypothetical protein